jgi:hypothetical protein
MDADRLIAVIGFVLCRQAARHFDLWLVAANGQILRWRWRYSAAACKAGQRAAQGKPKPKNIKVAHR